MQSIFSYIIGIAVLLFAGVISAFFIILNILKQIVRKEERGKKNDDN